MYDRDKEWMKILNSWSFHDILLRTIQDGNRETGVFSSSDDIVYCMFPECNKSNENLEFIYNTVGYTAHGDESAVFLWIQQLAHQEKIVSYLRQKGYIEKIKA